MYEILITDDEQIVLDSLSFIMKKNFEGSVNIHTALSGTEAIEIASKENIDIIFMDINMPGLTGLETVSCITKLKPEIVIVILSAFDKFQYAQEAMNLGAFKYITKPVNRNVVIQTVRSAMDFIDNRRGSENAGLELHKKLDLVNPMVESDFIYACVFNNDKNIDIDSYMEFFNIKNLAWCFICFEFPKITSDNQYETYLKIRTELNNVRRCLVSSFMMNRIAVLVPFSVSESEQEFVDEEIKNLYSTLSYTVTSGIRAGVSKIEKNISLMSSSYNEAVSALNKTSSDGGILFADESSSEIVHSTYNSKEFKTQILNRLRQGDSAAVKSFVELYYAQLMETKMPKDKIKNSFFELIVSAKNIVDEVNQDFESEAFNDAFSYLSRENDDTMLKDFLCHTLLEFTAAINSVKKLNENPVIKKICDYINDNLGQDISLEQMAEYAGVSSFYLSKLFKEEKGVTFINFLTDRRLEKACQLLKGSELSIKEITAQIGYNDQNYFSRLFKNKFGLSPSEYKQN